MGNRSVGCGHEGHEPCANISSELCVLCAANALDSKGLTVHKRRMGAQLLAAITHCNAQQARSEPQLLVQLLHTFLGMLAHSTTMGKGADVNR